MRKIILHEDFYVKALCNSLQLLSRDQIDGSQLLAGELSFFRVGFLTVPAIIGHAFL